MSRVPDEDVHRWIDTAAIMDLIYRYANGVTRADWQQVEAVFAPDALWESPLLGMRYERASDFLDLLKASESELLIQTASTPVIRLVDPDHAVASTTTTEVVRGTAGGDSALGEAGEPIDIVQYGVYEDEIARVDGEWRFTRRCFVPLYIDQGVVNGQVIAQRASLALER